MTMVEQLSLNILAHPEVRHRAGALIVGTLKITGDYTVPRDLNAGDELMVTIADADGQVLAQATAVIGPVGTAPIEEKDVGVVGTERWHKAKLQ